MKIGTIGLILAAFGLGAGAGYMTGYMVSENKFRIRLETERNKWNERKQNKEKGEAQKEEKAEEETEEDLNAIEGEIVDETTDKYKEVSSIYRGEEGVKETIHYDKCFDSAKEDAPVEHPETAYYISEEQYDNTFPEYDKFELEYYTSNQALFDPMTGEQSNADILNILLDAVRSGKFRAAGVLYIRDDSLAVDYAVTYIDGALY